MNKWTPVWIGFALAAVLSFVVLLVMGWFWYRSTPLQSGKIYFKMGCINSELHTSYEMGYKAPLANNEPEVTWCNQEKYYLYVTNGIKASRHQVTQSVWQAAQIGDHYSIMDGITQAPGSKRPPIACFVGKDPCK